MNILDVKSKAFNILVPSKCINVWYDGQLNRILLVQYQNWNHLV